MVPDLQKPIPALKESPFVKTAASTYHVVINKGKYEVNGIQGGEEEEEEDRRL